MTVLHVVDTGLLAAASYHSTPPDNAGWDVLYVAIGLVVLLAIVVGVGTYLNRREDGHHHRAG